jgi:hypothetical protein
MITCQKDTNTLSTLELENASLQGLKRGVIVSSLCRKQCFFERTSVAVYIVVPEYLVVIDV